MPRVKRHPMHRTGNSILLHGTSFTLRPTNQLTLEHKSRIATYALSYPSESLAAIAAWARSELKLSWTPSRTTCWRIKRDAATLAAVPLVRTIPRSRQPCLQIPTLDSVIAEWLAHCEAERRFLTREHIMVSYLILLSATVC